MQIRARDPSNTVARMLQLINRFRDGVLDLIAHPDRDERAHTLGLARPEFVAQISSCLTFSPMRH